MCVLQHTALLYSLAGWTTSVRLRMFHTGDVDAIAMSYCAGSFRKRTRKIHFNNDAAYN